jgi:hypothetical protein
MRAAQIGQCGSMRRFAHHRQPRHLIARRRHWPAAIVTTRLTFEDRNALAEETDFLAIGGHGKSSCGLQVW